MNLKPENQTRNQPANAGRKFAGAGKRGGSGQRNFRGTAVVPRLGRRRPRCGNRVVRSLVAGTFAAA